MRFRNPKAGRDASQAGSLGSATSDPELVYNDELTAAKVGA
jgi:hypothetical protein